MDFIRAFDTSALEMVLFLCVITGAVIVGKKLRDKKDEKDATQQ
ncbi:MAG: hypothetical protein ACERKZ_03670 [Lachnotalea sp.]